MQLCVCVCVSVLKRDVMMRLRGTRRLKATDDERFDEPTRISENEENLHIFISSAGTKGYGAARCC